MFPIIPMFMLVSFVYWSLKSITKDVVLPTHILSIFVNFLYIATVCLTRFNPSVEYANAMTSLIIAYYTFDTQHLLFNSATQMSDKLTYIPHHLGAIVLLYGQLTSYFPTKLGMWYLTMFEVSNIFLQFFTMAQKKGWTKLRNIVTYPFVATYVPIRGILIPIYSLKFVPYVLKLNTFLCSLYLVMFGFMNVFSIYFSYVVSVKFVAFYQKQHAKTA
jgi:hypothetical protein